MILEPKTSPDWKKGLLIVLLLFFLWKTDNQSANVLTVVIISILSLDFLVMTFLIFKINLFSVGNKIVIDKGTGTIQNAKGDVFEFNKTSHYKIPFNNLYIVRFFNQKNESKKMILNEAELLILEMLVVDMK